MHRCIGNDDLENKRIYEQSLHPEGIKKVTQAKERNYTFEKRNVTHSQERINKKINYNRSHLKKKGEVASIIAILATILSIIFSILEAILE